MHHAGLTRPQAAIVALMLIGVVGASVYLYSSSLRSAGSESVHIEIIGDDTVTYNPANFTAKLGANVSLVVFNDDDTVHAFTIDAYQVNATIPAGGAVTVPILADKAGTFQFYSGISADEPENGTESLVGYMTVAG